MTWRILGILTTLNQMVILGTALVEETQAALQMKSMIDHGSTCWINIVCRTKQVPQHFVHIAQITDTRIQYSSVRAWKVLVSFSVQAFVRNQLILRSLDIICHFQVCTCDLGPC